jgi:hypothetical protein
VARCTFSIFGCRQSLVRLRRRQGNLRELLGAWIGNDGAIGEGQHTILRTHHFKRAGDDGEIRGDADQMQRGAENVAGSVYRTRNRAIGATGADQRRGVIQRLAYRFVRLFFRYAFILPKTKI